MVDPRFVYLDALLSLADGHMIHRGGESAQATFLRGVPHAVHVFDDLRRFGWVAPIDGGQRFALTEGGRRGLEDGITWYHALPGWRRALRPRRSAMVRRLARPRSGMTTG